MGVTVIQKVKLFRQMYARGFSISDNSIKFVSKAVKISNLWLGPPRKRLMFKYFQKKKLLENIFLLSHPEMVSKGISGYAREVWVLCMECWGPHVGSCDICALFITVLFGVGRLVPISWSLTDSSFC